MKITWLLKDVQGSGGGNRVIGDHARHLIASGHNVELVGLPPRRPTFRHAARRMFGGSTGAIKEYLGVERPTRLGPHYQDLPLRVLETHRPVVAADLPDADIVIGTWWETVEWLMPLPPSKGIKVHFIQDHEVFSNLPQDRASAVLRQPTCKIVVAEWLAHLLQEEYGDREAIVVPNTVNTTIFAPPPDKWSRETDTITIGTLVVSAPRKRSGLAIAALEAARARLPGLKALCFGSRWMGRWERVPDWIDLRERPPQHEIPQIYGACDLWLYTSETEGFGLPLLESMACGTPVLATAAGAAPDLVTPEVGQLLEPDPHAFADVIVELAGDPERRAAMSQAARAAAIAASTPPASKLFEAALVKILASGSSCGVADRRIE